MGLATFIFGREISRTQLGDTFVVDCTISMNTTFSADVTKSPVQKGSKITDHINLNPMSYQIEGLISESPIGGIGNEIESIAGGVFGGLVGTAAINSGIGPATGLLTGFGALFGATAGGELSKFVGARDEKGKAPRIAMKSLIDLMRSKQPFTIRTFFHSAKDKSIYSNMVITNLSFPQSAKEGNSLRFNMTAEQIEIVNLDMGTVDAKFINGLQAGNSADSAKDLGQQGTESPKEPTKTFSSTLYDLSSFGGK